MAKRARNRESNILNNTSFLDAMSNTVGALAFLLLLIVLVTVALKLNYFELNIKTEKLPDAVVGKEYNVVLAGIGGNEPYTWSKIDGELPNGLEFIVVEETIIDEYKRAHTNAAGKIYGIPKEPTKNPTKITFQLDDTPVLQDDTTGQVIDKVPATKTFLLKVLPRPYEPKPLKIKTQSLPTAIVESNYLVEIAATGGYPPYKWEKEGELPLGLILDERNGRITGVPEKVGSWNFILKAEDSMGNRSSNSPNISLKTILHKDIDEIIDGIVKKLKITTFELPIALVGQRYDLTLAASGGIPPYRWILTGNLPDGLQFDHANGRIHGTPVRQIDERRFSVKVMCDEGAIRSDEDFKSFTITVKPAPEDTFPLTIF